jgi:hypothetical protein
MQLGPGHGRELAIRRLVDGAWFFLVVGSPPDGKNVLMSAESFAAASEVDVPLEVLAEDWSSGEVKRVFSSPGAYHVFVSDNLESELGGYTCVVKYSGGRS